MHRAKQRPLKIPKKIKLNLGFILLISPIYHHHVIPWSFELDFNFKSYQTILTIELWLINLDFLRAICALVFCEKQ